MIENKDTCTQSYMFTYKQTNFKKVIKVTQTWVKRLKDIKQACASSNIQAYILSNIQTRAKAWSKLKRNNESQVIRYITNSKTKQPKTL